VAGKSKDAGDPRIATLVEGARLEPIRVVKRELTRPDGTTLTVDVPVYPPFRLEERKPPGRDRAQRLDGRPATKKGKSQEPGR
jgi:hypothetical protein